MKYAQKLILSLLLLVVSSLTLLAQSDPTSLKPEHIPLDPAVKIGRLENGLTYYIRKNAEPAKRAELYLVVKAGSLQESDKQKGLAHFTEHMAFNGTQSFPKNELINYLQRAGIRFGADLNAYTGFAETVYQLPLPTDSLALFKTGFKILAEWAGGVSFDADEIDKERGVIVEEERQRGKNVSERLSKQLLPVLLANSRYAERLPIGDVNLIQHFEHQVLKEYYQDWYRPDLQAVIAVGDFDEEQVEQLIKKNFSALSAPKRAPEQKQYEIPANEKPLVKIATDPEFPYTVAAVIYKHPETTTKTTADFRHSIIRSAVSSMFSARISELVKSGNAPFLNAGAGYGPYQGGMANMDAFSLQVVAKKPDQLQVAIEALMDEALKMKRFGFTQSEFDRVKQNFMTAVEKSYKEKEKTSSKVYVNQYVKHFTDGEAIIGMEYSYDFYKSHLKEITLEEVNRAAAGFITERNQIVIVQASEDSKKVLPHEAQLLEWVNNQQRAVAAYVDDVVNEPLLGNTFSAGKTVETSFHEAVGTTEIVLSNGLKVVLKPTDFKNDEILFSSFSPGGYSLAKEADIHSSKMAVSLVASSGVGNFSANQLNKLLSGKSLAVSPYIGTYTEGIRGSASPQDLETALKLTYLYFTQARKDSVTFNRHIENSRIYLGGKSSNPMAVFQDTINVAMNGYGPWAAGLTLKQLEGVSLDRAYDFYQDRFADASDFTFFFVGNFKVDAIRPLLEKYLGALPATHRQETHKDVGIRPLSGQVAKTVYKGMEDKAVVVLSYHGAYKYSEENNLQLKILESALETRLLERLREKESGVYSPSVSLSYVKDPSPYYSIAVSFSCASDRVDQLVQATQDEIQKMQKKGPAEDEVAKFVAQEKRQNEVQLRNNRYWLSYLESVYANERNLDFINAYPQFLSSMKMGKVKKAAKRYLAGEGVLKLVLLPEPVE